MEIEEGKVWLYFLKENYRNASECESSFFCLDIAIFFFNKQQFLFSPHSSLDANEIRICDCKTLNS